MDHVNETGRASRERTEVTAVGRLGKVGLLPLKERAEVQADLEVDGETFGVEIHGKLAELTAGMAEGSLVLIFGKLKTYRWKTRGQQDRERVVILAEQVSLIQRPDKKVKRARLR